MNPAGLPLPTRPQRLRRCSAACGWTAWRRSSFSRARAPTLGAAMSVGSNYSSYSCHTSGTPSRPSDSGLHEAAASSSPFARSSSSYLLYYIAGRCLCVILEVLELAQHSGLRLGCDLVLEPAAARRRCSSGRRSSRGTCERPPCSISKGAHLRLSDPRMMI